MNPLTQEIIRLRKKPLSFGMIAARLGISPNIAKGLYYRAHKEPKPPEPRIISTVHRYIDIKPAKAPYAPDCSVPDFAHDDDHIAAIKAARGGFPIMPERRAA